MKIRKLRDCNNKFLSSAEMHELYYQLGQYLEFNGWYCEINMVNPSRIDVTGPSHGKGPQRNQHTYQINIGAFKRGYRRCKSPTWDHYVELNNAINDILDELKYSASIRSLDYIVRDCNSGRVDRWFKPGWIMSNETKGYGPVFGNEENARKYVEYFRNRKVQV